MEYLCFSLTSYCSDIQQNQFIKLRFIQRSTVMFDLNLPCVVHRASKLPDGHLGLAKYFATLKTDSGWMDQESRLEQDICLVSLRL